VKADKLTATGATRPSQYELTYEGHPRDRGFLAAVFELFETVDKRTVLRELDRRGYDLRTLRFSIRRKKPTRPRKG
jgi:hypothetical protein